MEEIEKLGDFALRLEKYGKIVVYSLAWVIFGIVYASALNIWVGFTMLTGLWWSVFIFVVVAGLIGTAVYLSFIRLVPGGGHVGLGSTLLFATPFIISYVVIPQIFNVGIAYYNLAWYPSLGLGLLAFGARADKHMTLGGLLLLATTPLFILLAQRAEDPLDALGVGLMAMGTMLLIYLSVFLLILYKATRELFRGEPRV